MCTRIELLKEIKLGKEVIIYYLLENFNSVVINMLPGESVTTMSDLLEFLDCNLIKMKLYFKFHKKNVLSTRT